MSHPYRPCRSVSRTASLHGVDERHGQSAKFDPRRERDASARRRRFDTKPDSRKEGRAGSSAAGHRLHRFAGAVQPLDADDDGVAEVDGDAEVASEGVADHFTLDVAVQRDRDLAPRVVLPHVDQRVFLSEQVERGPQRMPVARSSTGARPPRRAAARTAARIRPGAAPIASPIRTGPRPPSLAICPPTTESRYRHRSFVEHGDIRHPAQFAVYEDPVSFRTVPANMRTSADRAPDGDRSILNTTPDTGPPHPCRARGAVRKCQRRAPRSLRR